MQSNIILLIEEEEHLRRAAKIFLEWEGCSIDTLAEMPKNISKYKAIITSVEKTHGEATIFLQKPYTANVLLEIVRKELGKPF